MVVPQKNMRIAIQTEGRNTFNTMLLGTSSKVYGTKKSVTAVLYCGPDMCKSLVRPATFALPTVAC